MRGSFNCRPKVRTIYLYLMYFNNFIDQITQFLPSFRDNSLLGQLKGKLSFHLFLSPIIFLLSLHIFNVKKLADFLRARWAWNVSWIRKGTAEPIKTTQHLQMRTTYNIGIWNVVKFHWQRNWWYYRSNNYNYFYSLFRLTIV